MSLKSITNKAVNNIISTPKEEETKKPVTKKVEKVITPIMKAIAKFKEEQGNKLQAYLKSAIEQGKANKVKLALAAGAIIDGFRSHWNPLITSLVYNRLEIAIFLLENGARVTDDAFLHAGSARDPRMFSLFKAKGATINCKDENNHTPLHRAIFNENIPLTKFLIENGADLHAKDTQGETPFHLLLQYDMAFIKSSKYLNSIELSFMKNYGSGDKKKIQSLLNIKLLSAHFHLGMSEILFDKKTVPLDGHHRLWPAKFLSDALAIHFKKDKFHFQINQNKINKIIEALNAAFTKKYSNVQNKEILVIPTGWQDHSIGIAFWNDYMIIGNLGEGFKKNLTSLKMYKIDRSKVTDSLIREMQDFSKKTAEQGMAYYYNELVKKLSPTGIVTQDILCKTMEKGAPKWQERGNCSFASLKTLIYALVVLSLFKKDSDLKDPKRIAKKKAIGRIIYKTFSDSTANEVLEKVKKEGIAFVDPEVGKTLLENAEKHNKRKIARGPYTTPSFFRRGVSMLRKTPILLKGFFYTQPTFIGSLKDRISKSGPIRKLRDSKIGKFVTRFLPNRDIMFYYL